MDTKSNQLPRPLNDSTDFAQWKISMEYLLLSRGLGKYMDGTATKEEDKGQYERNKFEALRLLDMCLTENFKACIKSSYRDPKLMWQDIEKWCVGDSLTQRSALEHRFLSLQLKPGQTIEQYLGEFNMMHRQMQLAGITKSQDELKLEQSLEKTRSGVLGRISTI